MSENYAAPVLHCPRCWAQVQPTDTHCANCGYRPSLTSGTAPGPHQTHAGPPRSTVPQQEPVVRPANTAPFHQPPVSQQTPAGGGGPSAPTPPASATSHPTSPSTDGWPNNPAAFRLTTPAQAVTGSQSTAQITMAGGTFMWPVPDRHVTVASRRLPLEIAVIASVYGITGLWLLWEVRSLIAALPDLVAGVFSSNALMYGLSYAVLFIVVIVLYVVAALLAVAWMLYRTNPIGRGLTAVVFGALLAVMAADGQQPPALFVLVVIIAGLGVAVLFVSPWCRRALDESTLRHGRPAPVILSQTLSVAFFSLLTVEVAVLVIGLRFASLLGVAFVIATLLLGTACTAAWAGHRKLRVGPDRTGRWFVTGAVGLIFFGSLFARVGTVWLFELVLFGAILGPLWLAPSTRKWFGDRPLSGFID